MKTYTGKRTEQVAQVLVGVLELDPRNDLRNHSPTGFEWGYGGSGPAQLALALLADATNSDHLAQEFYQEFKREVVCGMSKAGWTLTDADVWEWVARTCQLRKEAVEKAGPNCIIV